jgi:CBS domain-containing protein
MRTLRVRDVMSRNVITVPGGTPFGDVVDLMLRHEIGAIPVVDDEGGLVGVVSEADLISKQAYGGRRRSVSDGFGGLARRDLREVLRSRGRTAREVMSAPVEITRADEPLRAVARRMVENRLKHMPVVDDAGRLVGIVSRRDLLRAFDRRDDEIAADVAASLESSEYGSGEGRVTASVQGGIVTLDGRVRRPYDVVAVSRLAWLVPGVVDVVHHLTVGVPEARIERTRAPGTDG